MLIYHINKTVLTFQKEFIGTLDEAMVRKLAIRGLRRGVGSMDYIHTLLIMEDDLEENDEDLEPFSVTSSTSTQVTPPVVETAETPTGTAEPDPSPSAPLVDWCTCGLCRP